MDLLTELVLLVMTTSQVKVITNTLKTKKNLIYLKMWKPW